jgi:hypothetical protein
VQAAYWSSHSGTEGPPHSHPHSAPWTGGYWVEESWVCMFPEIIQSLRFQGGHMSVGKNICSLPGPTSGKATSLVPSQAGLPVDLDEVDPTGIDLNSGHSHGSESTVT